MIHEYLEGTLDDAGRMRLAESLRADPAALAEFVDQMQIHGRLRVVESAADPVSAAVRREIGYQRDIRFSREVVARLKRRRVWPAAAAAVLLASLALFLFKPAPAAPAVIAEAKVARNGELVDVPAGGFLSLRLPDGRVELGPARAVVGRTIELRSGRLGAGGTLSISTPRARVEGTATWMTLRVSADATDLELEDGRLAVTRADGARLELAGGQALRVEAWTPVPLRRSALLVVGELPPGPGDARVRDRLEKLRFAVTLKRSKEVEATDAEGKDLVAISPTSMATDVLDLSGELRSTFRDAAAPLLVWEPRLYYDLGMIGGRANKSDWAAAREQLHATLRESAHPLAAGLSGTVRLAGAPASFSWGRAPEDAIRVAAAEGHPERSLVFAYESGAAMPGLRAPARRVGFFLFEETAASLSPEGWLLFDAAARWASERPLSAR